MLDPDFSPDAAHPSATSAEAPNELPSSSRAAHSKKSVDWGQLNLLLDRFSLIYGTDNVWDKAELMMMKFSAMSLAFGNELTNRWRAEKRHHVLPKHVVFDPSQTCGDDHVNLFGGMELEPKPGDVEPLLDLIRYLTSRTSDKPEECVATMDWLLRWLAYPLQNRGAKLRTAVIMHGDEGAGKNFLFDLVVEIYGKYGALVGQDELEDKFNDWRSANLKWKSMASGLLKCCIASAVERSCLQAIRLPHPLPGASIAMSLRLQLKNICSQIVARTCVIRIRPRDACRRSLSNPILGSHGSMISWSRG